MPYKGALLQYMILKKTLRKLEKWRRGCKVADAVLELWMHNLERLGCLEMALEMRMPGLVPRMQLPTTCMTPQQII